MDDRLVPREVVGDFDSKHYYRFYNDVQPNKTISSGIQQSAKGALNMTQSSSFSASENWQLYYQGGRYFIRNYDYLGDWQLGVTAESRSEPKLVTRTGALGQQWTLARTSDGKGYTLTNGLLGNGSYLALSGKNLVPAMQPSTAGAVWDIQINQSAGSPKEGSNMFGDVPDFEVAPSSSTSSSTASSTPTGTPASSVSSSTTPLPTASGSTIAPSSSKQIGTGAIAGIAVGAVCLLIAALLAWFFIARRRRNKKAHGHQELATDYTRHEAPDKVVYAHHTQSAELDSHSPVFEAQHKNYGFGRHELEGAAVPLSKEKNGGVDVKVRSI